MAAPFQADVVRHDDVHIFSEFDDEERKGYVEMILANNPGLARIPRGSMFYLWFAEKDVLRQIAYQEGDWSSQLVRCRLTTTPTSAAGDAVGTSTCINRSDYPTTDNHYSNMPISCAEEISWQS